MLCNNRSFSAVAFLTWKFSPGVAHTTQIWILPRCRSHSLRRMVMQTSTETLLASLDMKFQGLTLPVSSDNHAAIQL
jgi:hypothetical protein